ncbi:MAG: hypothetical protein QNJ70_20130 [Xenococcaceae cyanobacterium MO_207.B15]|nr:hypothetical protein [Xenococcaceae cyanobacterium MO_207.B15]
MVVGLEKKQEVKLRTEESQLEQESLAEEELPDFLSDDGTEEVEKVSYQDSDSDLDIPEDPYQVRTEKTFVNNPYNKGACALLLVGSGVFLSMHLLRFLMGGYVSLGEQHSVAIPEVSDSDSGSIFDEEVSQTPNEDLALHQALNQQSDEIKKVEKFNEAVKPVPEPEPEQVTTAPQPQQPTPSPTPVRTVSNTPPPRPIPVRTNRAIPRPVVEKKEPIDPMQQWLLAANMGSYGASNFNTQQVSFDNVYPNSANVVSVSYQESNPRVESQRHLSQETSPSEANAVSQEVKTISPSQFMRGTTAKAEVELPIVWMELGGQYNHQRDYLIRLKQPLLGSTGAEIAPKGSMAVVKASQFYGDSGLIQLEVTSLIISERGINREYPVPPLSLIILNKKGGILEAKADKGNNFDRQAASFLLSGVATAASVANRPSSTFSSSFGSSTTFGERDLVGGFIEGATTSAVNSINQSQSNLRSDNPTVYTIKAGTPVQLVVNKSFSLGE